jgi:toxin-antitoxin system PIN domain toxin
VTFLLDVNVLIALIDPLNSRSTEAHRWFSAVGHESWATCPLTENGTIRIVGNLRYLNSPGNPGAVAELLTRFVAMPGHTFWPDDISLLDREKIGADRLLNSSQVTDSYLVALAIAHGGQLATFDRRVIPDAVRGGASGIHLIQ